MPVAARLLAVAAALAVTFGPPAAAAPATPVAGAQAVMIMDYRYQPGSVTVDVGDRVTWTNHDEARHDVSGTSGPAAVQSPELGQGESWSHTFTQPGDYAYLCRLHPDMTATVTVKAAAPAPTPPPTPPPSASPAAADVPLPPGPTDDPAASPSTTSPPAAAGAAPSTATSTPPPTPPASAGDLADASTSSARPASTRLPPLAVAAVVIAVVLACTFALLGATHAPNPTPDP